jgi:uncharacterized protein (TIGR00730 family)
MTHSGKSLRRVAVFCGSALGNNPEFRAEATVLGAAIAQAGLGLVYGGACRGLMGVVADAALAAGAEVIGVLPDVLQGREIAHNGLTSLELVPTMHERKARMHELADAILTLPGGFGTLDELLEAVTWAQIGLHAKPCILINTAGYWSGLLAFLDTAVASGFIEAKNKSLLRVAPNAAAALQIAMGETPHSQGIAVRAL